MIDIGTSGSGRTNTSRNLLNKEKVSAKMHLYVKDQNKVNINMQSNRQKIMTKKHFDKMQNAFDDINDAYKNIETHCPKKDKIILIVFDDMTAVL